MGKYLRYYACDFDRQLERDYAQRGDYPCRFIFDMFELDFGKTPSPGIAKLLILFCPDRDRHMQSQELLDVLEVAYFLDLDEFSLLSNAKRAEFFLASIRHTFEHHGEKHGWEVERCREVCETIASNGIRFDRYWKRPVRNKQTGLFVQVHVSYFAAIEASFVILDKKKRPLHKKLLAVLPGTVGALEDAHGQLSWDSATTVRLTRKNGRDFWQYNYVDDELAFHFPRAESGDAHGQYDLGMMYLKGQIVFPDREKAIHWLTLSAGQGYRKAVSALDRLETE